MGGGLSVGPSPGKRTIGGEWPQIRDLYRSQFNQFGQFSGSQPLFNEASSFLNTAGGQVPGGSLGGAQGFLNEGQNFLNQGEFFQRQEGGLVGSQAASIRANVDPILASGGALTAQQERDVTQQTDAGFAARGMGAGNQAFTSEFLNRDAAKQNRYNQALSQSAGVASEEAQLQQGALGLTQGALGLEQGGAALGAERFGQAQTKFGDTLGLQQAALGQETSQAGVFQSLTDPLLQFAGNLFGENLQAQQQTQAANQNKGGAIPGQAGSVIGNILGGIAGSDKRLKEKIKDIGEKTPEGIPIKTFQFKGDKHGRRYMGVIAQDVEKFAPHAVVEHPSGMKMVNFSAIHAPFHALGDSGEQRGRGGGRGGKNRTNDPGGDGKDGRNIPEGFFRRTTYGPGSPGATRADKREHKGIRDIVLRPGDVALQPWVARKFGIRPGETFNYGGKHYRYADNPAGKVGNVIDIFMPAMERGIHSVTGPLGRMAGNVFHHGRGRGGFPSALGRSGYPRAIAVRGGRHHRGMFGGESGPGGGGGIAPGSIGFGGPGSGPGSNPGSFYPGPGGGFPSSTSVPGTPPNISGPAPGPDPYSNPAYDPYVFQQFDPWTAQDFTGFVGATSDNYGSQGGIQ